jgi:hypothetical protein
LSRSLQRSSAVCGFKFIPPYSRAHPMAACIWTPVEGFLVLWSPGAIPNSSLSSAGPHLSTSQPTSNSLLSTSLCLPLGCHAGIHNLTVLTPSTTLRADLSVSLIVILIGRHRDLCLRSQPYSMATFATSDVIDDSALMQTASEDHIKVARMSAYMGSYTIVPEYDCVRLPLLKL